MNFYHADDIPDDLKEYFVPAPQIGLEASPDAFVAKLVDVFREVRRVLRDDGTLWLNLGDSYANDGKWGGSSGGKHVTALHGNTSIGRGKKSTGLKPKDLIGIPWRVAFALQADGWYLRQDIIWHKPNPMPESVLDRCTKAHEYIFLLSKSERYYFDSDAMQEPAQSWTGRAATFDRSGNSVSAHVIPGQGYAQHRPRGSGNKERKQRPDAPDTHGGAQAGSVTWEAEPTRNRRSVWTVATKPYKGAHFATFPPDLIRPCVLAGCPKDGTVLDPFGGSGTTALVALEEGRKAVLCELNTDYIALAHKRLEGLQLRIA